MAIPVLSSDPEPDPKKKKTDEIKGGGGEEDGLSEVSVKGSIKVRVNGWLVSGNGGGMG